MFSSNRSSFNFAVIASRHCGYTSASLYATVHHKETRLVPSLRLKAKRIPNLLASLRIKAACAAIVDLPVPGYAKIHKIL